MYNTVTNNYDWKKGYAELKRAAAAFHSTPSLINNILLAEETPTGELEALADAQMYRGAGIKRYDGTWSTPEEALDDDLFGDDMMRISYENGTLDLKNYDLKKGLGWLANTNENLKNYIDAYSSENPNYSTIANYYNLLDGKTKNVIKAISDVTKASPADVQGKFVLAYDDNGTPYWQEVLTTKETRQMLEAAGISVVNSYGIKKYSDGVLTSGVRSFVKGLADFVPNVMYLTAAVEDLGESVANAIQGEGFKADRDALNVAAEFVQDWLDDSMIGQTSYSADYGTFDNWEGFASGLGQGGSSLIQYALGARAVGFLGKAAGRTVRGVAEALASSQRLPKMAGNARKVVSMLSAEGLTDNSLGVIGRSLNKILYETPEVIPMYASGITLNFGEAYKAALDAGLPLEDAAVIGFATGVANTIVEQKFGSNVLNKYLAGQGGARKTAEAIVREVGGDVKKLSDKATSDAVLTKIVDNIGKFTKTTLGQSFEEGAEEIIQGFVKNSVESFYDSWIAPSYAVEKDGLFGTEIFRKDEWVLLAEEGVIGSILGLTGGFANSRQKENSSIIPYLAAGKYEELKAAAALAKQSGAISEEQYNGVIDRATKLEELRKQNRALFEESATLNKSALLDDADAKLKMLRDQADYAESQPVTAEASKMSSDNKRFELLIEQALENSNSLNGVKAFAQQLRNNGKNTLAAQLEQIAKESEKQAKDFMGKPSAKSRIARSAHDLVVNQFAQDIFRINQKIANAPKKIDIYLQRQRESTINSQFAADFASAWSEDTKYNEILEKLIQKYENAKSDEEHAKIKTEIKNLIIKHATKIKSNKSLKGKAGLDTWVDAQASIDSQIVLQKLYQIDLQDLTSKEALEEVQGVRTQFEELLTQVELSREQQTTRTTEINKQKEVENAASDTVRENEYSDYKNSLAAETELTPERQKFVNDVLNGDEITQVNALETERTNITKILNNLSKEERTGTRGDLLREDLKRLNRIINYVRNKYNIKKTEADKNKRYKTNLAVDDSVYTDDKGSKYVVNRPATQYSENEGMVLQIIQQGEDITRTVGTEEGAEQLNKEHKKVLSQINYELNKEKELESKNRKDSAKKHRDNVNNKIYELSKKLPNGYMLLTKSSDVGPIVEIVVDTNVQETIKPESKEYTEANDSEFLNSLVDENGIPLSTKINADKRIVALQLRTKNPELAFNFEPVREEEVKDLNSTKTIVEKINTFVNKLKGIIIGDGFKKAIADPKTDAKLFKGGAEVYIWDKASKEVKDAKELFDNLRKNNKKWEDCTQEQKDLLIDYLPIQLKLTHPYLKNKEGKEYENIVSIPARKSDTSKAYSMQDDLVTQRESLISNLLNNGSYEIKPGDIEIQPGYFNTITNSKPTSVLLPDGTEVQTGESVTGDLRDIKSLNITKENGKYWITLPMGKQTFKYPLTVAIAGQTGTIDYTHVDEKGNVLVKHADGVGSPGTPYLIIPGFLNLNKKDTYYPLKLNPRRIDKNTATTIAKLMYSLAKGYATKEVLLNSTITSLPNVFGINTEDAGLTVEELLNDLIYWGHKTLQNDPDPAYNKDYLKNKQLYIDFKKGVVKYGANETILEDGEEALNKFINWITNNKSFAIDRSRMNARDTMQYTYSIEGGYKSVEGTDYTTSMIDNKVVTTNLDPEGTLYKGQFIRLNTVRSSLTVKPVEKPKPEPKIVSESVATSGIANKPIHSYNEEGLQKNAKAMKVAMLSQNGKITIGGNTKIVDSKNKTLGDLSEFEFVVKDGKINGITIDFSKSLSKIMYSVIEKEVLAKYKDADLGIFDDFTFTPDAVESSENKPAVNNPRVNEVYSKVIANINEKFKGKTPNKLDITGLLDSLVDATTGVAKLYGFTDYKEARLLLKELGDNGKTLEQNIIDYMRNMSSNEDSTTDDLAAIAATVFTGRKRREGTINKLITDQDKKEGWQKISETEKKQLRKILGNKHVEWVDGFISVLDYIGNPAKAFGATTKTVTEIMKGAKEGTGYHEAFHNVSLFALSPEERQKMYDEARRTWSELKDKDNKAVEEFLADRFMDFALEMLNQGKTNANEYKGVSGFFKKAWDWVKTMFGFKPSYQDINVLFKKIYSGNYSRVSTNKDSLVYFDNTYGKDAKVPLTINGRTLTMNSRMFSKIIDNLTAQLLFDNDITSLESVRKGIDINVFKSKLETILQLYTNVVNTSNDFEKVEEATALVNIYTEILDNWDSVFKPFVENKLANYGIRRRAEDATFTIDEDLKGLINDELVSAWEINAKHNAKAEVRMLFLALQKTKTPDSVTKLPQYENPDVVWYNVISKLHSAKSFDEMMERLEQLSEETNRLTGIANDVNPYSELRDMLLESGNETLKTQFFVTMKKHKNKFINFTFSEDGNGLEMRTGDADINKRSKKINQAWSKTFAQSNPFSKEGKETLKSLQAKYTALLESVKNEAITEEELIRSTIELLAGIRIVVDENTIRNVIQMDKYRDSNAKKSLNNFLVSGGFSNVFANKGKTFINKIIQDSVDVNKIDSMLANETLSKTLAESYVRVNPSSEDDSVLGPQGNAVYSYSENNTITSMFEEWLKDEEFLAEIKRDIYSQNSDWLKQLSDPVVRRKIGVKTVLGIMNREDYANSRGYLEISDKEDLLIKLRAVMEGNLPLPTLANKKSYYLIHGLAKQTVRLNYIQGRGYQLNPKLIQLFKGYAFDEFNAIKLAYQQRQEFVDALGVTINEFNNLSAVEQRELINSKLNADNVKVVYSDLVENYHYSLEKIEIKKDDGTIFTDNKMILKGNGYAFRYFRELDEMLRHKNIAEVEAYLNSDVFENDLRVILNRRVNDSIKTFIDAGIINVGKQISPSQKKLLDSGESIAVDAVFEKGAYNYIPVNENGDMYSSKGAIAQIIADYAINTAVSTIEFEKLVSGDLAFYKSKSISAALDDRVKRYSALTSTRLIMNSSVQSNEDFDVDFDTRRYRSITLATNVQYSKEIYDTMYNKYVGTLEEPGLLYQRFIDFAEKGIGQFAEKSLEELYEMAKDNAKERLNGYLKTDPTDAQVWISPKMFRKLAIMNGEWSRAKEEAYKLLESDKPLTVEEELKANTLVMQPLKYVHYGFMYNSKGVKIPVYDKMSLATLFRRNVVGTNLKKMYDYMIKNDVDMVKMETAVKSGNRPKQTYYNQNGEINDLNNSLIFEQDYRYIGKQLVTDPHEVERTTLLTQFIKIAVSNVDKNSIYQLDGRDVSGEELLDQYNAAIENLSNRGAQRIKEKFGFKNGKVDKRKLIKMLNEAALQTNVPQNLIDALQYSEQDKDYYVELSTLPSLNWIHSRIISLISKETIDITTPGNAFYQTTSFGHDLTGKYRKVVGDNTIKKYDDKLRFKNENGRLEVKLSINLFRGAIPSKYKTFEELRKYILANKELFAFAYRVPTQGMNSTLPIEIVDIVPTNAGDVVFLPLEVTALTGSDFDIDKMYMARYNYFDNNGVMKKVEFIDRNDYDNTEEFLEAIWYSRYGKVSDPVYLKDRETILNTIGYIAKQVGKNKALSTQDKIDLIDLAQDYSKYISRKTIMSILNDRVNDFEGVKQVLNYVTKQMPLAKDVISKSKFIDQNRNKSMWELNKEEAVENRLLDIFSATLTSDNHYIDSTTPLDVTTAPIVEVADKMKQYFEGDSAIQSLAPLFPSYQEDMKSKNTGADRGIGPMALINVFRTFLQIADIKLNTVVGDNNIMQKLGIDTLNKTYDNDGLSILDWTSALINAHVDAAKDPYIMRLNVNQYTYNTTAFLISAGFGKSTFYFLPQPILKDLAANYMRVTGSDIGIEGYEKYSKKYLSDVIEEYESLISKNAPKRIDEDFVIRNLRNAEWLEKQIATSESERNDEWYATQLTILDQFLKIQEYADGMRDAINAVQIDTKKYGINSAELLQFGHLVQKVENSEYFVNPKDLFNKTFIGIKYKNSIELMFELLGGEVMDFAPGFVEAVELIEKMTYTYYKRDERTVNSIANEVKSALYGQFFNSYLQNKEITVKDLFYGRNSVVSRVQQLQKEIAEGNYRELKDNELLKMLLPNVYNNDVDPMTFENSTTKQRDTDSKNAYTFAWMDLLEHEDERIRQLGNDLILYSFYMGGGLSNGVYNFYDLVPYGYLANFEVNGKTFQSYVKNLMHTLNSVDALNNIVTNDFLDVVFKSGWRNKNLVPEISLNSKTKEKSIVAQSDKNGNTEYVRLSSAYTGFMSGMDGMFKPFVKLYNKKDPNSTLLFKLVGYFETPQGIELVYGKTNKLGFDYKGFRIKESTAKSSLPTNKVTKDFSEELELSDKLKNGDLFVAINPYTDVVNVNQINVDINSEGDVETSDLTANTNTKIDALNIIDDLSAIQKQIEEHNKKCNR